MKTDSMANENQFFSIISKSNKLLPVEAAFSSTGTYSSANPSFQLVKMRFFPTGNSIFSFQVFLC